jgi:superfamily II DNA or RNA helicase/SOS-response transcriptional repressor LexA
MADRLGFSHLSTEETGCFFKHRNQNSCLIVDTTICTLKNYHYVDYTSRQNQLFHSFDTTLRVLHDGTTTIDETKDEIQFFLQGGEDLEKISSFGRNRTEQDIDPTRPEATFEDHFIEAFGESMRSALQRESRYTDFSGNTRFVDYMLFTNRQKFAIELNGETFHHPVIIGPKKYRSQLFKQNSLSVDGFKVYRWSNNGMRDKDNFIDELKTFFGKPVFFLKKGSIKVERHVETITLHDHQKDALKYFETERAQGKNTFLLVLPTGTGKTEIFIKDIEKLKTESPTLKALIMVPTKDLRLQTVERFKERTAQFEEKIGTDLNGPNPTDLVVQTYAFMHRHYYKYQKNHFDYVVVDEAHHAAASGLRSILEYYTPKHLLGVTATAERFDRQKLEELFGEYESPLSLEDAIKKGLVPPVRCFRIKSNIDLSEVRFNGKDYVKSDLQTTLIAPSRDTLVANTLSKYFSGELACKQGVVFCVDIKHAERMADCLNKAGISTLAVNGRDRKSADEALKMYRENKIRFLCACDLLTEGWDAPQTSILVMARPTFSKVLYTQQLGRGLRNYPEKEALYVLDVVDNYGARLLPMSLHALFSISSYVPFGMLIDPDKETRGKEIAILAGLFEDVRRIEPINIHNFENLYGDYLNEEQLARELFVSTGTVKSWVKKNRIEVDFSHPFGRSTLHFFNPAKLSSIRAKLGLSEHSATTRKDDFLEFLEKRDYTYSYKIIFLLAFLKLQNKRGEALLPDLLSMYQAFYQRLLAKHGKNEKQNCPYVNAEFLQDSSALQRNLLQNPFEKFERKRFFRHCKDLNYIALDGVLREHLKGDYYEQIESQMTQDLKDYFAKQDIELTAEDYDFLLSTKSATQANKCIQLFKNPADDEKYKTMLPLYELSIAAGSFLQNEIPTEIDAWVDVATLSRRQSFDNSMFVARVVGKSMEPEIADGSYCLFTRNTGGTRNGRIVLAQKAGLVDQDTSASYTIKRYESSKKPDPDTGWTHESIRLRAINPDYEDILIQFDEAEDFNIIAFFMECLASDEEVSF